MQRERVSEALLSRIWNEGWHSPELRTTDGRRVSIVYRGVWTHSNGPDFRDAMIEIDDRLLQGSVELHVRSSDWDAHGHSFDPAYDAVVLHVVLEDDSPSPRFGPSRGPIPTVLIAPYLTGSIEEFSASIVPVDLGDLGSRACLPTLAGDRPEAVRQVLRREGWRRLHEKQLRFQQEMIARPPAEVLYRAILDSLGLSANRPGMEFVADGLPLVNLERISSAHGRAGVLAALLGVAGFLPLSPGHQTLLEITSDALPTVEGRWETLRISEDLPSIPATVWNLNRVRPLNHPARRLGSMASLLVAVGEGGLLAYLVGLPLDGGRSWNEWLTSATPAIGLSRRRQITVNALAPFMAAYAEETGDDMLVDAIAGVWEQLRGAVDDDIARKTLRQITGERSFPVRTALEVQGLHHIGRHGCAKLRCFECPIAALAVRHEQSTIVN